MKNIDYSRRRFIKQNSLLGMGAVITTGAILPVHILGLPTDMERIMQILHLPKLVILNN